MYKIFFILIIISLLLSQNTNSLVHDISLPVKKPIPFLEIDSKKWVDSVFNTLSPDQRLAQLFMVAAYSNKNEDEKNRIKFLVDKVGIGGLIFMQGGPVRQANLTNYYQSISQVPLMIAMDAEWGLSMRIDSTPNFQKQLMWGALQDDAIIYEAGKELARECRRLGVHISFSPDVDVNNNALNPVIGDRSFGENKIKVAQKGIAYMQGLQDGKVLACAKHFPGHGDTDKDSHKTLPTITATKERLDSLELYPFKELINAGVGSVMVAHLNVPSLDTTKDLASTLSHKIVTDLLKTQLGFEGLIFTDALNMKGVADYYKPGEVDMKALLAGNDVLLFSGDVVNAIKQINMAIDSSLISREEIDKRVKKILACKYWLGLNKKQKVEIKNLYNDINNTEAELVRNKIITNAITLVENKNNLIPFNKNLDSIKFASVSIGSFTKTEFQSQLSKYTKVVDYHIDRLDDKEAFAALALKLKSYDVVFVGIHKMNRKPNEFFGISDNAKLLVDEISKSQTCVLTLFGNPYALEYFKNLSHAIVAYTDDTLAQNLTAQLIFGGLPFKGVLPVSANDIYKEGRGYFTSNTRLYYSNPAEQFQEQKLWKRIDSISNKAIRDGAFPGCQVYVAQNGKIVYDKSFGFFTYDNQQYVTDSSIYDIASVTKTASTTLAVMKLWEQHKILLSDELGKYLTWVKGTNKEHITIKDLLLHQAGLKAWIPFFKSTVNPNGSWKEDIYARYKHDEFSIEVSPDQFMNRNYLDSMRAAIINSPVASRGNYLYSDLDFIFLGDVVESITGMTLDKYVSTTFYQPLGLQYTCYQPLINGESINNIVPSNYDYSYRKQLIRAFVHDPGAAMMGGVAGHAGLFSTANELGVLFQILINKGTYGGIKYFDTSTIVFFTSKQIADCRRGLGFDKAEFDFKKKNPCSDYASAFTFGHQGFTGTCVWADPAYNLVYVFLSNRTFPNDENSKINTMDIRSKIQDAVYRAIGVDTIGYTRR